MFSKNSIITLVLLMTVSMTVFTVQSNGKPTTCLRCKRIKCMPNIFQTNLVIHRTNFDANTNPL